LLLNLVKNAVILSERVKEPVLRPVSSASANPESTPNRPVKTYISYASLTPSQKPTKQAARPPTASKPKPPPESTPQDTVSFEATSELQTILLKQKSSLMTRKQELIQQFFEQETKDLEETQRRREAMEQNRLRLIAMRQVASKLRFQLLKEDKEALQEALRQESQADLDYQREMSELEGRYR